MLHPQYHQQISEHRPEGYKKQAELAGELVVSKSSYAMSLSSPRNTDSSHSLKFNFKLGGYSHAINGNGAIGVKTGTMVVGADVTHAGKCKDPGCPSLAGVVGTIWGMPLSHYQASARLQPNNTEVSLWVEEWQYELFGLQVYSSLLRTSEA